jgi:hypothetical protein
VLLLLGSTLVALRLMLIMRLLSSEAMGGSFCLPAQSCALHRCLGSVVPGQRAAQSVFSDGNPKQLHVL